MTGPSGFRMNSLGDAWISVHADTDPFERELNRGTKLAAEDAEDDMREVGKDFGDNIAEGAGERLRESGPKLAREVQAGLSRQKVRTKVTVQLDKDNNVVRKWVSTITDEIGDAFDAASKESSGPFAKLRMAIADAIGAGFNISGRSPLIGFLLPLLGTVAALIIGAIQGVNSLIALLVTVPGLIAAIGIQAGVLMIAFQGVGTAIQDAFAATNAKELDEALKNLTPSAQQFVRELLPLREIVRDIRDMIQENFFRELGSLFGEDGALLPLLATVNNLGQVASALGNMFRRVAEALGSPEMVHFIDELTPVLTRFLGRLGPALAQFITGLAEFAGDKDVLDMLSFLGEEVTIFIARMGTFFSTLAGSEGFGDWLDRMKDTFGALLDFITASLQLVATLVYQIDQAGGQSAIDSMTEAILVLSAFLGSDVGREGLRGLIMAATFLFQTFVGLVAVILSVFALFSILQQAAQAAWDAISQGVIDFWHDMERAWENVRKSILGAFNVNLLYQAGRNIIQGLINGILSMVPNVRNIMSTVMAVVRSFTPFSPAKEGPLSGSGDPLRSGRRIVERLAAGMTTGIPELRSATNNATSVINFGPGAIRVGFEGALPTTEQARTTGAAVGSGITSTLARNTQMAVRMA